MDRQTIKRLAISLFLHFRQLDRSLESEIQYFISTLEQHVTNSCKLQAPYYRKVQLGRLYLKETAFFVRYTN